METSRNPLEAGQKFNKPGRWLSFCAFPGRNPLEAGQKFNAENIWKIYPRKTGRNPLEAGQKFNLESSLEKTLHDLSQSP